MDGEREHPYSRASELPHCEQASAAQNVQETGNSSEAVGSVQEQGSVVSHFAAFRDVPTTCSTLTQDAEVKNLPALMGTLALERPGNRSTRISETNHGRDLKDGVRSMTARTDSSATGQGTESVLRIRQSIVKVGKRSASWPRRYVGGQADLFESVMVRRAKRSKASNPHARQKRAGYGCFICQSRFHDLRQLAQHYEIVHRKVSIRSRNARVPSRDSDEPQDNVFTPIGSREYLLGTIIYPLLILAIEKAHWPNNFPQEHIAQRVTLSSPNCPTLLLMWTCQHRRLRSTLKPPT